jgi:hypothetical protein
MKRGIVVALVVLTVTAGVMATTMAANGQGSLHVVLPASTLKFKFVDFGKDGPRLGDRLANHGPLLDETRTTRVGKAFSDCLVQRRIEDNPFRGLFDCEYVLKLQDGNLVLRGLDPHGPGSSGFAVLGGTGSYSNARGEATFTDSLDATDMVISLTG